MKRKRISKEVLNFPKILLDHPLFSGTFYVLNFTIASIDDQNPKTEVSNDVDDAKRLAAVDKYLHQLFVKNWRSITVQGDDGTGIYGVFDEDWMPERGIKPFEPGEFYIGGDIEPDCAPLQMFSKTEMYGWMRFAMSRFILLRPHLKEQVLEIERNYYAPEDHDGVIEKKIAGKAEWDCEFPHFTRQQ